MIVACKSCGADLRVNRNLAGTTISCPECGERLELPTEAQAPKRMRSLRNRKQAPRAPAGPRRAPMSLCLLAAQALLVVLALSCFAGIFFRASWNPPAWSYLHESELLLAAVGIGLLFAAVMARRFPILATLGVVLTILLLCVLHYRVQRVVDASRVIALGLAMFALWLAMEHRGVT